MRLLRPAILALLIAGAFFYFTTWRSNARLASSNPANWLSQPADVEITEAAGGEGLDSEEQNNISVYTQEYSVGGERHVARHDIRLLLWAGSAGGPRLGLCHRQRWPHPHQLSRHRGRAAGGSDDAQPQEIQGHGCGDGSAARSRSDSDQGARPGSAVLGDSRNLQVGQKVYAIGNPFGLAGTMTRGIVSSIRPVREPNGATIDEAIQTDAAINPGNSGGPLMNWHGEVIGINTMILSSVGQNAGIGFAIPINTAKAVLNDLMTLGRVRRPALGVRTIPISAELADEMGLPVDYGLLIVQVTPGGSADAAGLRGGTERAYLGNKPIMLGGDLIVAIDGEKVEDEMDLSQMMNNHRAGDTVKVTIYRNKKKLDVTVALAEAREQV